MVLTCQGNRHRHRLYLLQASAAVSARKPLNPTAHKDHPSDHDQSLAAIELLECRSVVGNAWLIGPIERLAKFNTGFATASMWYH